MVWNCYNFHFPTVDTTFSTSSHILAVSFLHLLLWHWSSSSLPHLVQGIATGYEPNHTGISNVSSSVQMCESPSICCKSHSLHQKLEPTVIQQLRHWFNFVIFPNLGHQFAIWVNSPNLDWSHHCHGWLTSPQVHSQDWSAVIWHLTDSIIITSWSNLGADNWSHSSETISLSPSHQVIHFKIRSRPNQVQRDFSCRIPSFLSTFFSWFKNSSIL